MIKIQDIHQGDVYWVSLNPTIGTEAQKTRPGIVVSSNILNASLNRVMIVPITSQIKRLYPFEASVSIDDTEARAMADQMRAIDKRRLGKYICTITKSELRNIQSAIKIVLELE